MDPKEYWKQIKKFVRKIETDESWISIDDTICSKPHSTENEIANYYFDHTVGKVVKGINILNFLFSCEIDDQVVNCPISYLCDSKNHVFYRFKKKNKTQE